MWPQGSGGGKEEETLEKEQWMESSEIAWAILRTLAFTLNERGSHWRAFDRVVTQSAIVLRHILAIILRIECWGRGNKSNQEMEMQPSVDMLRSGQIVNIF